MLQLSGIHHVTAITAQAVANLQFYSKVLGMRLVKKTVNQDDTGAYHLFYGDGVGSPGSDMTFFDWPLARERRGNHSVSRTAFRVNSEDDLEWWRQRLLAGGVISRAGEKGEYPSLDFEDPEGQRLRLVADNGGPGAHPWEGSTVPAARQIKGLGPVTMSVPALGRTETMLVEVMNMRKLNEYIDDVGRRIIHVFAMGEGGPAAEVHVAVEPELGFARQGAGGVHHVAFRVASQQELRAWTERLAEFGLRSSGEVERFYFRSLYFREPNGVLFEIATDMPGFSVDEPLESLGMGLSLPPFLEPQRAMIEAGLKPLE